jgi:aryl-alcohol dehydrogenase-like predicted oxidoreductase
MRTRKIGSLEVSVVGMGCRDLGSAIEHGEGLATVLAAMDAGVTYFDTAEGYGAGLSEQCLGDALAGRRDAVCIGTKFAGPPEQAGAHLDASLRRLKTDYVDLYTLHHPVAGVPLAEFAGVLSDLAKQGKIREFGCSNLNLALLRDALRSASCGRGFTALQNDYNLFNRKAEFDILPACAAASLAFVAYFPLYHGFLSGAFQRDGPVLPGSRLARAGDARRAAVFSAEHFDALEALSAFAAGRSSSVLDIALARLLAEPGVTMVIPGFSHPSEALDGAVAGDIELTAGEIAEIDRIVPSNPAAPDTPSRRRGFP